MSRKEALLSRVLLGGADANIRFDDLRKLLTDLGFQERSRGSHHVFAKPGIEDLINLQREGIGLYFSGTGLEVTTDV
jgi:hypothetical protein